MNAGLLWTAVGSVAGVLALGLVTWQIRLQLLDRRERHHPTAVPGAGGLPVAVPVGRLPTEVRGRELLLGELRRLLSRRWRGPGQVWVLAGMGGLGKSTVALAVAASAQSAGWRVWWVTASDATSLAGGMLEVLYQLGAPESVTRPVREGAATAADRAWRFLNGAHAAGRRWLLVLDNADDPAVLGATRDGAAADHAGWLRPDPTGMVVVTTRNKNPLAWGPGVLLRELQSLEPGPAAQVLTDLAPSVPDPSGEQARELARRLGGLPLALHLAGSYLASPFARWRSFADYRNALDSVELPAALADLDRPGSQTRITIQRTWDVSLDALTADGRPQARRLLLLLSCYAPATPIPGELLQAEPLAVLLAPERLPADGTAELSEVGRRQLREGMHGLADVGLIDLIGGFGSVGIPGVLVHPVVADANRARLLVTTHGDLPAVGQAVIATLQTVTRHLDSRRPGEWAAWHRLIPHLLAVLRWLAAYLDPDDVATLLDICDLAADALWRSGHPATGESLARSAISAGHRLGDDHPACLLVRHRLAQAIGEQGHNSQAEHDYQQLLPEQQHVLGERHPRTLTTRHDLAGMIENQGRYPQAQLIYRQVLTDRQQVLGDKHPDTLATHHRLARIAGLQGRYREAEHLCRQVITDREQVLGADHPETLGSRHNLTWMVGLQGRYQEAERLGRQVLDGRRRILGTDHPETLSTVLRVARIIADQGRYQEAEQLGRQVLADRQRILGPDHPVTFVARNFLAWVIGRQGRYAEAERLCRQILADRESIAGDTNLNGLTARHNLAWMIGLQGRYDEAEQLFREVLTDRRRALGDEHPITLDTMHRLAGVVAAQGRKQEALDLYQQVFNGRQLILGTGHPDTVAAGRDLTRLSGLHGKAADTGTPPRSMPGR